MADVFLAQDNLVNYFNEIAQSAAMLLRYRLYTGDLLRELNVPQMKFLFTMIRLLAIDFRTQSKHFATSLLRLSKTLPAFDHWSWAVTAADGTKQREAKTTNESRRGGSMDTSQNTSGATTATTTKRTTPPTTTIMDAQTLLTQQLAQQMRSPTLPPGITIAPVDVKLQERYIELKRVVEEKREILKHKMSLAHSMVNEYHDQSLITALRHLELAVVESTETIRRYDLALDEMSKQQEQYEKYQQQQQLPQNNKHHHPYNQQITAPQPPDMPSAPFRLMKRPRFQQYMPDFDASLQSTNQLPNTKKMSAAKRQKITRYYQNKVLIIQNILTKIGLLKHALSFAVYRTNVLINKVLFNATSIQNIVRSLQMIVQNQHAYHPAAVSNTF